jgi:hypothetical protein
LDRRKGRESRTYAETENVLLPLVGVETVHPDEERNEAVVGLLIAASFEIVLASRKSLRGEGTAGRGALDSLELRLLVPREFVEFFTGEVSGGGRLIVILLVDLLLLEGLGADELRVGAVRVAKEEVVGGSLRVGHGRLEDVAGGQNDDLVGLLGQRQA